MAINADLEIDDVVRSQPQSDDEQTMETQHDFATQLPASNAFIANLRASAPTALMGQCELQRALKLQSLLQNKHESGASRTTTIPRPQPSGSEEATSKPDPHLENGGGDEEIPAGEPGDSGASPGHPPLYRSPTPSEDTATTRIQNGDTRPETAASDPWRGLKRIRRRDVKIPKDQEKLLNGADCWIPAEPGKRAPVGRIPIKLLEKLNLKAERRARGSLPADENKGGVAGHELEPGGQRRRAEEDDPQSSVLAESDGDVSSEVSWQASPPPPPRKGMLPPDSSPEGSTPRLPRERLPREDEPAHVQDEDVNTTTKRQIVDVTGQSSFAGCGATPPSRAPAMLPSNVETDIMEGGSQLNDSMASPGPSQFVTREEFSRLDGTFIDGGEEESDLETMIPHALGDKLDHEESWPDHCASPEAPLPSTAVTNDPKSVLQVKRTPYLPSYTSHRSLSRHNSCASRKEAGSPGLDGEEADDVGALSSDPVIPATFVAEQSSAAGVGPSITSALPVLQPSICDDSTQYEQQLRWSIEERIQDNWNETAAEHGVNRTPTNSPEASRTKAIHDDTDVSCEAVTIDQKASPGSKRRLTGSGTESGPSPSKAAKRKRHFRPPTSFNFSQEKRNVQDPALLNKMHKREFLSKPLKPDPGSSPQQDIRARSASVDPTIHAIQEANKEVVKGMRDYNARKRRLRETAQVDESVEQAQSSAQPARHHPESASTDGVSVREEARIENHLTDGPATDMAERRREPKRRRTQSSDEVFAETSDPCPAATCTAPVHEIEQPMNNQQQGAAAPPLLPPSSEDPRSGADTIYETFRATYPQYPGTQQNFVSACVYIEWLVESKSMVHRSLWDDFICRQATEYPAWAEERTRRGEAFTPFEDFYNDEVEEPQCTKGVIKPKNLESAIRLDTAAAGKMRYHAIPQIKALINGTARPLEVGPRTPVTGFTPARQVPAATTCPEVAGDAAKDAMSPRGVQDPGLSRSAMEESTPSCPDEETSTAINHSERDETSVGRGGESKTVEAPGTRTPIEDGRREPCTHVHDQQRTRVPSAPSPDLGSPTPIWKRLPLANGPPAKEEPLPHSQNKSHRAASARGPVEIIKSRQSSSSLSGRSKLEPRASAPPTRPTKRMSECSDATIRQLQAAASRACSQTISPPSLQRRATAGTTALVETSSDGGSKVGDTAGAVARPSTAAWWQDANSPFKQFTRSYVRLKSMEGKMGCVDENQGTIVPPLPKKLDFLTWTL